MPRRSSSAALLGFVFMGLVTTSSLAEVTVGVSVSATGNGASLGIPYKNAYAMMPKTIAGEPVRLVLLDDASDPSNATRNARRFVSEDKVDVILGGTLSGTCMAIAEVAAESSTPQICGAPIDIPQGAFKWVFSIAQPLPIMMEAVVEHMKANGVKTASYIGFGDHWGENVEKALKQHMANAGIKLLTSERYARSDTSVQGQVLRTVAAKPDAVVLGGAGTPGALPHIQLVERGYKGPIYQNHGVVNNDFIRVGAKSVEGALAPTGPLVVVDQLPQSNPLKKTGVEFKKAYEATYGKGTLNAFAGHGWDAVLLLENAIPQALKKAKPGTAEFRNALRDALENTKELVGTHAVFNLGPKDHNGTDSRARVLVKVKNGTWELVR
ncbi:ABC transporter substrate-binding protein [Ramlibacter sp.]|uniref:ABC transporter substrate-binding protein n=1 Tax=Ramlibacter sp. TaxID=1917967 RepID=UPI003FA6D665